MKTYDETPKAGLMKTFTTPQSRRNLLKGAALGVAGLTAAGAGSLLLPRASAHASGAMEPPEDTIVQILSIAATAEQLAVTFYTNAIANAKALGISGTNLVYLKAAVIEEQIHQNFLVAAGGTALTSTFSFPSAGMTFTDLPTFVNTLNTLETAFVAAYLAAVSEFSQYNQPRLAQIAGQILAIESEHRALGRTLNTKIQTVDDRVFAPALVESVGDAVGVLAAEGFLSPVSGNSYTYAAVSTTDPNVVYRTPFAAKDDND